MRNTLLAFMLKTPTNPTGMPMEAFDGIGKSVGTDRPQFWKDLGMPFYGFNRPGQKISEGLRASLCFQSGMTGFPASYSGTRVWFDTDLTEDLERFDVPTLIRHGDDDQIVPVVDSAVLSAEIVKDAILKVYPGLPRGMRQTHKDRINADVLEFVKSAQLKA